jgi:hypothetical protein
MAAVRLWTENPRFLPTENPQLSRLFSRYPTSFHQKAASVRLVVAQAAGL